MNHRTITVHRATAILPHAIAEHGRLVLDDTDGTRTYAHLTREDFRGLARHAALALPTDQKRSLAEALLAAMPPEPRAAAVNEVTARFHSPGILGDPRKVAKLHEAFAEALVLADGEAVDAVGVLIGAVAEFLGVSDVITGAPVEAY